MNPEALERELQRIAAELRQLNPSHTFIVDHGAVWLVDGDTDYGYYSATIDGRIVYVVENGRTVLHRPHQEPANDH